MTPSERTLAAVTFALFFAAGFAAACAMMGLGKPAGYLAPAIDTVPAITSDNVGHIYPAAERSI